MSTDINVLKLEMRPFVKRSVTTGPGNIGGTTLVDATLVEAANFWNDCWVLLRTGTYAGQLRRVTAFVAGTITLDHTVGGQIIAAVQYVMFAHIPVQDSGLHTNPRRYEKLHGIVSARVASGIVAQPLWAVGLAAVNPVGGRTAGQATTAYALLVENSTGAAITVWLEDNAGNPITIDFHVANNDSIVIPLAAGMNFGDMDIYVNASAVGVVAQLVGTEE